MTKSHEQRGCWRVPDVAPAMVCALLFALLLTSSAHAQNKSVRTAGAAVLLQPGEPAENSLSGGATYSYGIQAENGQFLHVNVEQVGIHISLTLYSPDRKQIAAMENPNGKTEMQQISSIAKSRGIYTLELASGNQDARPGRYRAVLEELRAPTSADLARISAEQALMSAGALFGQAAANSSTRAAQEYERALPLWRTAGDAYEEALTLNVLGNLYLSLGERAKALDCFNQALPLARALADHARVAAALDNIGSVYYGNGEKEKALDQFTAALAFEHESGEQTHQAETLAYLGQVLIDLGQTKAALSDFEQSLVLTRQSGDQRELPAALNNVGRAHDVLGEKQKAIEYYNQSLAIERASGDRYGESRTLSNIGMVYDDLGDRRTALDNYEHALKIEHELRAFAEEAATRNNVAAVYDQMGRERKALSFYNRALAQWRKSTDVASEAMALNNVGFTYHNLGQDRKALSYYNQALPISRRVNDLPTVGMVLHNIGVAEDRLGNRPEALTNLSESLFRYQEVQDPLGLGLTFGDLMAHFRDAGNPNLAIFFGKEAVNSYQQIRRNITGLSNDLQKKFIASKESTYRELADLLIIQNRFGEAKLVLDLLKKEEYFEFIQRGGKSDSSATGSVALAGDESAPGEAFENLAKTVAALGVELTELEAIPNRTDEENLRISDLNVQLNIQWKEWYAYCSNLQMEINGSRPLPSNEAEKLIVAGIKGQLGKFGAGTVALYTLVGEKKYRVILITSDPQTPPIPGEFAIERAELNRKVFEFRQALQDRTRDPKPLAENLYRILVGPVASELKDARATTLMWSLDGALRYLPVAALHDGHEYLVSKYQTEVFSPTIMSNLGDLPDLKNLQAVGMGVSKAYGTFRSLPSVSEEIHRIIKETDSPEAEGVVRGQTMLDETFTIDNLKRALKQKYPVVHIASHFALEPGGEANSFLLLGGTDQQGQHLTLAEIANDVEYNFRSVDLLTLSACDTAMGGPGADGAEVDGLAMLAQEKGARAVVASLWAVDDRSTALLMERFYRAWISNLGGPKSKALQEAQILMMRGEFDPVDEAPSGLKTAVGAPARSSSERGVHPRFSPATRQYSHPYYWAPFILMGNWQ